MSELQAPFSEGALMCLHSSVFLTGNPAFLYSAILKSGNVQGNFKIKHPFLSSIHTEGRLLILVGFICKSLGSCTLLANVVQHDVLFKRERGPLSLQPHTTSFHSLFLSIFLNPLVMRQSFIQNVISIPLVTGDMGFMQYFLPTLSDLKEGSLSKNGGEKRSSQENIISSFPFS